MTPPDAGVEGPGRAASLPKRYSELSREDLWTLRLLAALEVAYPQAGGRNTRIIEGYEAWVRKGGSTNVAHPGNPPPRSMVSL